ncbi:Uncharacterised protein [Bordetella pertussis]|nr:Uncharacterised protein [Bordetella pertussis]CFW43730.1 Uncharacterised protein [Bordetella pertussis]
MTSTVASRVLRARASRVRAKYAAQANTTKACV